MPLQPDNDPRTPSPPFGYSRPCDLDRDAQIRVVAQFHANRIRPNRIAFRMGIDIAFVEALIAGEVEAERFPALVEGFRRQRYRDRIAESAALNGSRRFDQQQRIERDYLQDMQQDLQPDLHQDRRQGMARTSAEKYRQKNNSQGRTP